MDQQEREVAHSSSVREVIAAALLLLLRRRPIGQVADVGRMRKLQIDERVFALQPDLDDECGADIVHGPLGSGQRLIGAIRRAPEKLPSLVLNLRGIKFKNLMLVNLQ